MEIPIRRLNEVGLGIGYWQIVRVSRFKYRIYVLEGDKEANKIKKWCLWGDSIYKGKQKKTCGTREAAQNNCET